MKLTPFQKLLFHTQRGVENTGILNKNTEGWHMSMQNASNTLERLPGLKGAIGSVFRFDDPKLSRDLWGQTYKNPIGIAAGFMKEADGMKFWEQLGVGYMVIGGVMARPQAGNPKPRMFRLKNKQGMINFMGFPSTGLANIMMKLEKRKQRGLMPNIPVWANLGNNHDTADADRPAEFAHLVEHLFDYVDVFELNFSCPNQKGVAQIQTSDLMAEIIRAVQRQNERMALQTKTEKKPITIKIAAVGDQDLSPEDIRRLVSICADLEVEGIVVMNSSKDHSQVPPEEVRKGGLTGKLVYPRALESVRITKDLLSGTDIKLIGVGGVGAGETLEEIGESATKMVDAGADLLQAYTGLIQRGTIVAPTIIKKALVEQS